MRFHVEILKEKYYERFEGTQITHVVYVVDHLGRKRHFAYTGTRHDACTISRLMDEKYTQEEGDWLPGEKP